MSGLTRGTIGQILHQHLGVEKRLCRYVPHRLTEDQKNDRVKICRENLKMWRNRGQSLIDNIITGDETYVHYYVPKSRAESKIWVFDGEIPLKL